MNELTVLYLTIALLVVWMIVSTIILGIVRTETRYWKSELEITKSMLRKEMSHVQTDVNNRHEDDRLMKLTIQRYFPNFMSVYRKVQWLSLPVSFENFENETLQTQNEMLEVARLVKSDKECHNGSENVGK